MPPPTAKRVSKGIYRDAVRWYATVHVRGAGFREKRFPQAVSIESVQAWRESERVKLLSTAERGSQPGTFRRDAQRYIRDFTAHLNSAKSRRLEVMTWIAIFGDRPRGLINAADVARVRTLWRSKGLSPKTINNRVNTLRHLYRSLDGKRAWTPCDDLQPMEVHKTPMRFVTDDVILAVDRKLQQLERSGAIRGPKTRARFRVLVSTGRRPSEIMRTAPGDLDLRRRIWLPRDGKGGFSPGIYLNADMLAAWKLFIKAEAWGHYDTYLHAQRLRLAGWPADVKPYNARHTVGITLSEKGVDLDDIGPMLGHKRRETTRKHYVPVLNSRMQKVAEALEGRFAGWKVQTKLQTGAFGDGKNRRKPADHGENQPRRFRGESRRIPSRKRTRK
jgi:integrase